MVSVVPEPALIVPPEAPKVTPRLLSSIVSEPEAFAKVVVCKIEDPNDPYWVEDWNYPSVKIDATEASWVYPEEEEEEQV